MAGAAALAFPAILTTPLRGASAPSNRITIASIGLGGMGMYHLRAWCAEPSCVVVALCDCDAAKLPAARAATGLDERACYSDFREVLERSDVDAVDISTPDHWHTPLAIAAIKAGKAVYLQKPVSLTIAEGRALIAACRRYGGIVQVGSQQRSDRNFRLAAQIVRNGRLGRLKQITVGLEKAYYPVAGVMPTTVPPVGLDYDRWLGPAPFKPYTPERTVHFRGSFDYSGGYFSDWGAHHFDIVQWALGMDDSGPVSVDGRGVFWKEGIFDVPHEFEATYRYADGTRVVASQAFENGILFEGERGHVFVSRTRMSAEPRSLLTDGFGAGDVVLPESRSHDLDFLAAVREGRDPLVTVEIGHRSATMCHMGNIAMVLGRELAWDPKAEMFVGDDEANRLQARAHRAPWGVL